MARTRKRKDRTRILKEEQLKYDGKQPRTRWFNHILEDTEGKEQTGN
jgi:hypothetical protein